MRARRLLVALPILLCCATCASKQPEQQQRENKPTPTTAAPKRDTSATKQPPTQPARPPAASGPTFAAKTFELHGYKITAAVNNGDRVKKYASHLVLGSITMDDYSGVETTLSVQPCSDGADMKRTKPCPAGSEKGWAKQLLESALSTEYNGKPVNKVVEPVTAYSKHAAGFVVVEQRAGVDAGTVNLTVLHANPAWPHVVRCHVRLVPRVAKLAQQAKKHCVALRTVRSGH